MTVMRPQLAAASAALFAAAPDWTTLSEAGYPLLLVPEAQGGVGGDWGDAFAVLRAAGAAPLAQPLGEAMIAAHLLAKAGQPLPTGLCTIGNGGGSIVRGRFTGWAAALPWGRVASQVLATVDSGGDTPVMLLLANGAALTPGTSPAGEPRDRLDWVDAPALDLGFADHNLFGAFIRIAQSAGALETALALAVEHVNSRIQFGKALSKLQAVQQELAILASEAAAAGLAGAAAAEALDRGGGAFEVMAARLRTNMAIHRSVGIAHQVHGAIGFTRDYPLHPLTRRLMGWRSDYGGDKWAERLGALALREGGGGLWAEITRLGDG